jgi:hypothetical protein
MADLLVSFEQIISDKILATAYNKRVICHMSYDSRDDACEPASVAQCHTVISQNYFSFKKRREKGKPYDRI